MTMFALLPTRRWAHTLRLPLKLIPNNRCCRSPGVRCRAKRWIVGSCLHGSWLGSYKSLLASALVGPEGTGGQL